MIYLWLLEFINQFITRGHHLVEAFYLSFLLGTTFGNLTNMDDMQIPIPVFTHLHPGRTQFFVLGVDHVSKYPCHMMFSWQCIFPILSPDMYIYIYYIIYIFASSASPIWQIRCRMGPPSYVCWFINHNNPHGN